MVQLLRFSARFVLVKVVNTELGVLAKLSLNVPSAILKAVRTIGPGAAGEMSKMAEELGVPFTNTVSSAKPGGKLVTGRETKELVCQSVVERKRTCPFSMERN